MSQLSRSASEQLAKSTQELNALRATIAAEQLPLAQELTALEERAVALRQQQASLAGEADKVSLELPRIRHDIEAIEGDLGYVITLLDEYARTFDAKINISELQYCGEAIETAKQAGEDKHLSMSEKFERQIAFVNVSLKRLYDAIGGMRFPGVGVDMEGTVTEGQFAIIGPVALFSAASGGAAGLVIAQSGSTNPLIRPLEGALQAGIAALVDTGEGLLPLDPSRGGALKALIQKTKLTDIFVQGGPIMWPLLLSSILALGVVLERFVFLMRERMRRDPKALESFFAAIGQGDIDTAIRIGKETKFFVVRALGYALAHRETSLANAILYAQAQELKRFQRGVSVLDTVITLAPLLGLLGTVTGMMGSFSLIGGDLGAPGAITGGIAEALIATAFGLGIAITALLPFNLLNTRLEDARHEIESAGTQLELLVQPPVAATVLQPAVRNVTPSHAHDAKDEQRKSKERQRQRLALEKRIADLQAQLDDQEFDTQALAGRDPLKD
ncbi:MAG: MotA/TolQ/ExbB proton channel family protein [Planctomycetota bacterium]